MFGEEYPSEDGLTAKENVLLLLNQKFNVKSFHYFSIPHCYYIANYAILTNPSFLTQLDKLTTYEGGKLVQVMMMIYRHSICDAAVF